MLLACGPDVGSSPSAIDWFPTSAIQMANNRRIAEPSIQKRPMQGMGRVKPQSIDIRKQKWTKPILNTESAARGSYQREYALPIIGCSRKMGHV